MSITTSYWLSLCMLYDRCFWSRFEIYYNLNQQFFIISLTDTYEGGLVSNRLYATDKDVFDAPRLRYSLASPDDFENFVINPQTGAVRVRTPLTVGKHSVSVRVSDGTRSSISSVNISVQKINENTLSNSVTVQFMGVDDPELYWNTYHTRFASKLSEVLPVGFNPKRDLFISSLQAVNDSVQLLVSVRTPRNSSAEYYTADALKTTLESSKQVVGDFISIGMLESSLCPDDGFVCKGVCSQDPKLHLKDTLAVTVPGNSLVTHGFARIETCTCPTGHFGPECRSYCDEEDVCSSDKETCHLDATEMKGYKCSLPSELKSVFTFQGTSFLQYKMSGKLRTAPLQFSFRVRTYQANATIFYVGGNQDFVCLQTQNGLLSLTFDCGGGITTMLRSHIYIHDGKWHDVVISPKKVLQRDSPCAFELNVDGKYSASVQSPGGRSILQLDDLMIGGIPYNRDFNPDERKRAVRDLLLIRKGFRGCLEDVKLNSVPLKQSNTLGSIQIEQELSLVGSSGITDSCVMNTDVCFYNSCENLGTCVPSADGGFYCDCQLGYTGERCEKADLCQSLPCKNKGVCLSDGDSFR